MLLPQMFWRVGRAILRARHYQVIAIAQGGFGHTLATPDALRRIWPRSVAVVCVAETGRHNPFVAELFSDCDVSFVSLSTRVRVAGREFGARYRPLLAHVVYPVLATLLRCGRGTRLHILPQDWHAILPEPELADAPGDRFSEGAELLDINAWPRYYRLQARTNAPPARLPEERRRPIEQAIRARGGPATRTCCLYLRDKGGPREWASFVRSGGPLSDYVPAIARLIARGYRVLVTGDRSIDREAVRQFGPMLLDAESLGIDRHLFSLFAATECDIWIGEDGGGTSIPMIANRPMLGINWFPYYAVFPNITLFYKYLRDARGGLVAPHRLFNQFAFDWECRGYDILNNAPAEIAAAVDDFAGRIERGEPPGIEPSVLGPMVHDIWFHYARAYISEPWLRPFTTTSVARKA
jgi:putative glycosyltransferase (TIGR04372 family)